MNRMLIGFLCGLMLGTILTFWGTEAWIRELQEANKFLEDKLREENK